MHCPKCGHEPTLAEVMASPDICPNCSVVYAKVLARQEPQVAIGKKPDWPSTPAQQRPATLPGYQGVAPQPVVVVDVRMSFWSMVVFMVKWAFATIPAILIILIIVVTIPSIFGFWGWIVARLINSVGS